jgi:DNA (cytosine-5)-methyltransferase 1
MKFGSVCSGIGAAEVAWAHRGWSCAFMSEIDGFPRAVLKTRQPEGPLHGDFTTIRAGEYAPVDVLVGGTPCQSFSVAGFRGGLADARGNLALEYLRLADRLRPRWVVWENVPGVLSSAGGRDFGALLGGLAELGYGFAWRVLDAQYFGVAQRRRRLFLIGHAGDWRRAAAVLFERQSLSGDPPPRRSPQPGTAVSPSLRAQSNSSHREDSQAFVHIDDGYLGNAEGGALELPFLTAANLGKTVNNQTPLVEAFSIMPMNSGKDYKARETEVAQPVMSSGPSAGNQGGDYVLTLAIRGRDGFDAGEDGTGRGTPLVVAHAPEIAAPVMARSSRGGGQTNSPGYNADQQLVAFALRGREGGAVPEISGDQVSALRSAPGGSSRDYLAVADPISASEGKTYTHEGRNNFRTHNVVTCFDDPRRFNGPHGGLEHGDIHPTLESTNPKQFASVGSAVRRLTPRECERLQGFPDDYTLIPWRGREATDGPRYRALGNSMAVPVMAWLGARIDLVDGLEAAA